MAKHSAGILLYRPGTSGTEIFLVHPGGPFFARKDTWSIPKGEFDPETEDAETAARREFQEETGGTIGGSCIPLAPVRQPGGKIVHAFAARGDFDPRSLRSNAFLLEWPPGSGKQQSFPEVDRGAWFTIEDARRKINTGQAGLLDQLEKLLS